MELVLRVSEIAKKISLLEALHFVKKPLYQVSDVTIRNCFRHGGFIRTKQEDNPDIIEKPADLSDEDYEACINVDVNLDTAEKTTEETICQAWMNRRDGGIELEDNDDEPPSAQETLQTLRTDTSSKKHSRDEVIVVAATNRPNCIDAALLRPGRFDIILYVPAPNCEERQSILETLTNGMPLKEINFKDLADKTEHYTGADLKNLCNMAAMNVLRQGMENAEYITEEHFLEALEHIKPSVSKEQIQMYEQLAIKYGPIISE
ncbi:VCP-like ATPase [Araneus ventricosus]|uniref:VCP-like ATPase n=1 Tax=Araneus ventricosus TaxID=182803 RepID=A0A4Y2PF46_ARAVE|nr:VCP-like ATPase [Araneus ventricosus]